MPASGHDSDLPRRFVNSDRVHRSFGSPGRAHRIGLGFSNKSGKRQDASKVRTVDWSGQLVLRGLGWYEDDRGEKSELRAGTVFERLPDRVHTTTIDPASGFAECFVYLDPELWRTGVDLGLLGDGRPVRHGVVDLGLLEAIQGTCKRLSEATDAMLPDLALEVMRLAGRMLRQVDSANDPQQLLVDQDCRRLAEDFSGRWSLPILARGTGLSWERFRKLFTERTGLSPQAWRLRRRIDRARELLLAGDGNVTEVAQQLGYPSPFAFSTQFKQMVGVSPNRYRLGDHGPSTAPNARRASGSE